VRVCGKRADCATPRSLAARLRGRSYETIVERDPASESWHHARPARGRSTIQGLGARSMQPGTSLGLTPKGIEELRHRTYRLDVRSRNILFLIETGQTTLAAIAQKSPLRREEIDQRADVLLAEGFVAIQSAAQKAAASRATSLPASVTPQLKSGVSLPEARFALSDFCLDCFGVAGQTTMNLLERCNDEDTLRKILAAIVAAVEKSHRGQLPVLAAVVEGINATKA